MSVIQDELKFNMVNNGVTNGNCYIIECYSDTNYVFKCKIDMILNVAKVTFIEIDGKIYYVD